MRDLSLHLLDIVENSTRAQANIVEIVLSIDQEKDKLVMQVRDDGCGMDAELLARVTSPFATTRTERNVGLGIPMLLANAEQSGGHVDVVSTPGKGTRTTATFGYANIDRPPLGDIVGTMVTLIAMSPEKPDFVLRFSYDEKAFTFDTREIRTVLGPEVPLAMPEVLDWIKNTLREQINEIMPQSVESMEGMNS